MIVGIIVGALVLAFFIYFKTCYSVKADQLLAVLNRSSNEMRYVQGPKTVFVKPFLEGAELFFVGQKGIMVEGHPYANFDGVKIPVEGGQDVPQGNVEIKRIESEKVFVGARSA